MTKTKNNKFILIILKTVIIILFELNAYYEGTAWRGAVVSSLTRRNRVEINMRQALFVPGYFSDVSPELNC